MCRCQNLRLVIKFNYLVNYPFNTVEMLQNKYMIIYNNNLMLFCFFVSFSPQPDYLECNPFSMHDNRNSFQDHGVYFGHVSTDLHSKDVKVVVYFTLMFPIGRVNRGVGNTGSIWTERRIPTTSIGTKE